MTEWTWTCRGAAPPVMSTKPAKQEVMFLRRLKDYFYFFFKPKRHTIFTLFVHLLSCVAVAMVVGRIPRIDPTPPSPVTSSSTRDRSSILCSHMAGQDEHRRGRGGRQRVCTVEAIQLPVPATVFRLQPPEPNAHVGFLGPWCSTTTPRHARAVTNKFMPCLSF